MESSLGNGNEKDALEERASSFRALLAGFLYSTSVDVEKRPDSAEHFLDIGEFEYEIRTRASALYLLRFFDELADELFVDFLVHDEPRRSRATLS